MKTLVVLGIALLFVSGPLLAIFKSYAAVIPPPPVRDYRIRLLSAVLLAEARGEGPGGIERVAEVISHRMSKGLMTADEVVLKPRQFSCLNGKNGQELIDESEDWVVPVSVRNEANRCAYRLVFPDSYGLAFGPLYNRTKGATHYCATGFKPSWAGGRTPVATYKNHDFYRL